MAAQYESAMRPWFAGYRDRRSRREKQPVHDFLFEYYQTKRQRVERWHPPVGVLLEGVDADAFSWIKTFEMVENGLGALALSAVDDVVAERLRWIQSLIEAAMNRPARFQCFGLHEWAMVYRSEEIRHESTPLRLPMEKIAEIVEARTICCSHWDAYRFFTEPARPLNTLKPDQDGRHQNEQFGCVHFNMDLYKWCYKAFPWVSSELTLRCFNLAIQARELDMCASPYDVRTFGLEPILIETAEGSIEYQRLQRGITEQGKVLGAQLVQEIAIVLELTNVAV